MSSFATSQSELIWSDAGSKSSRKVIQLSSDVNYGHSDVFHDVIYDIAHPVGHAQSGPHDFVNNDEL
jgi:hypothetical protein